MGNKEIWTSLVMGWGPKREREIEFIEQGDLRGLVAPLEGAGGYEQRFNLQDHLWELSDGWKRRLCVWDGGAASGRALAALQKKYPVDVLGINAWEVDEKLREEVRGFLKRGWIPKRGEVDMVIGLNERLSGKVRRAAKKIDKYPPDLVLFSNSLPYSSSSEDPIGTLPLVFVGLERVLPEGGWALIYDGSGEISYPIYEKCLGLLDLGFEVERRKNEVQADWGSGEYLVLNRIG